MSVKELRLSHISTTTDTWGEMCKNFTFQFTQHSNGNDGRGAQTEEKRHSVIDCELNKMGIH